MLAVCFLLNLHFEVLFQTTSSARRLSLRLWAFAPSLLLSEQLHRKSQCNTNNTSTKEGQSQGTEAQNTKPTNRHKLTQCEQITNGISSKKWLLICKSHFSPTPGSFSCVFDATASTRSRTEVSIPIQSMIGSAGSQKSHSVTASSSVQLQQLINSLLAFGNVQHPLDFTCHSRVCVFLTNQSPTRFSVRSGCRLIRSDFTIRKWLCVFIKCPQVPAACANIQL